MTSTRGQIDLLLADGPPIPPRSAMPTKYASSGKLVILHTSTGTGPSRPLAGESDLRRPRSRSFDATSLRNVHHLSDRNVPEDHSLDHAGQPKISSCPTGPRQLLEEIRREQ